MVKHEIKKLPESEIEVKVSVSWEDWKKFIDEAVKDLSKDVKIAGFRPGKAPRGMVEQQIGTAKILTEAAERAIKKTYADVLDAEKIDAIGAPQAEILKLAEGNDLEYKITTAVMPQVKLAEWKGKIKKVNEEFKDKKAEVTEVEINKELEKLAGTRAKLVTVRREAKNGDNVMVDFTVKKDGVPIENGTSKNHPLILGKGVFIPGFEDNVIGMKENEEKEFELEFPKDYHEKSLAGQKANFQVKVQLVQEREVPEINDEFAKSLGKFENLEALKKSIREGIEHEKKHQIEDERKSKYVEELIGSTEMDIPHILIHEELDRMVDEFRYQLQGMGMELESYLERIGKKVEDLEKDWHPQAEKRIKAAFALEEIAKQQEINIPSEKVEESMNQTLQYYKNAGDIEKKVDLKRLYNYSKGVLTNEEVFKLLEKL
jgi:trigger factor